MGNAGDAFLRMDIVLTKRVWCAGERIEGEVRLISLADRPYPALHLVLKAKQQTQRVVTKCCLGYYYRTVQTFQIVPYQVTLTLAEFPGGLKTGHYRFPFSLLLPSAMPSSFYVQRYQICCNFPINYIKYGMKAFVGDLETLNDFKEYSKLIHVRQPFRGIERPLTMQKIDATIFCFCCCHFGNTKLALQFDVPYIYTSRAFHFQATVDNTISQVKVNSSSLILREHMQFIDQDGLFTDDYSDHPLFKDDHPVPVGDVHQFQGDVSLPERFLGYTAIGTILARRHYKLILTAHTICCAALPKVQIPVVVISHYEPETENDTSDYQQLRPQFQFQPETVPAPKVQFNNLPPYTAEPHASIGAFNQDHRIQQEYRTMPRYPDPNCSLAELKKQQHALEPQLAISAGNQDHQTQHESTIMKQSNSRMDILEIELKVKK